MKKLVISLMIVALAVSAQAGTLSEIGVVGDLNLTGVVYAENSGSQGPGPDDYPGADDYSMTHLTTVMDGVTFDNTKVGAALWDGHNDDLFLYQQQIDNGWDRDGQKFVGAGGSAAPIAWTDTLCRLYDSAPYNPSSTAVPGLLEEAITIANGTYEVQILFQQRGNYMAYSPFVEMFSIEGQDSDFYDVVAMNEAAGNMEYIDAMKAYISTGWCYTDTVTVSDGVLNIAVTAIAGSAMYNAIIVTPEPASMVLLGLGGLLLRRRK